MNDMVYEPEGDYSDLDVIYELTLSRSDWSALNEKTWWVSELVRCGW